MALIKTEVTQEIVDYLARHAGQDEVLERVARETAELPLAQMATTPDEAAPAERWSSAHSPGTARSRLPAGSPTAAG
jgi:hypothetical protein